MGVEGLRDRWGRAAVAGVVALVTLLAALALAAPAGAQGPTIVQPDLPSGPDEPPAAPAPAPSPAPAPAPTPAPAPAPAPTSPPVASPGAPETPAPDPDAEAGPTPEEEAAAAAEAERRRQAAIARRERLERIAAARAAAVARIRGEVRDSAVPAASATLGAVAEAIDVAIPAPVVEEDPVPTMVLVVGALLAWVLLVMGFLALERRGRTVTVVMLILAVVLVDVSLYASPNDVNGGILNPSLGGFAVSTVDALIMAGIAAHLLAGKRFPVTITGVWWLAFAGWLAAAALIGLMRGHPLDLILFSGRAVLYIGLIFLAASVPMREYLSPRGLPVVIVPAALISLTLVAATLAGTSVSLGLPGFPDAQWGQIGADTASFMAAFGVLALALAVVRPERRVLLMAAAGVLIVPAVFATQRAALLGAALSLLVLGIAFITRTGRRRSKVRRGEVIMAVLWIMAAFLGGTIVLTAADRYEPRLPGVDAVDATFNQQGKASSASARIAQWEKAATLVRERPVIGQGLGYQYEFYSPGPARIEDTKLTHNIGLDLLLRTGVVGLLLFLGAAALTARDGVLAWLRHADDAVAALALGCVAALAALMAKGAVESVFEKYRLMVLLGVLVGMVVGAALSVRQPAPEPAPRRARRRARARRLQPVLGRTTIS